ncbi:protein YAE1 homolog isoform X1 [Sapajus apella]|uniref:Protein YAE1 homolog isoform X1 n=1 Tax=Sapajus apella TaxID=9515 RepID=A0A6J3F439_SAPAP|nr:protein YAE1 homolog isoform X1 [Sapajus apella]
MSWLQAASSVRGPGDEGDVFDEEADESLLVQREWQSHMQRRVKVNEGYRDGVDAGKAVTLQQGFNQGYKEGAEVILNYGRLRGTLSALLSWCHLHNNNSTLINKINNLLDAVGQCEEYVLKHLKSITPPSHVVDLLDSIEDMDLCHVVPAEKKIDEATDERLCENNAEFNKNCSSSHSGIDFSYLECCRTQEHAHSENPSLTWILEQTASLVKQLGISVDVLQHLKQL